MTTMEGRVRQDVQAIGATQLGHERQSQFPRWHLLAPAGSLLRCGKWEAETGNRMSDRRFLRRRADDRYRDIFSSDGSVPVTDAAIQ